MNKSLPTWEEINAYVDDELSPADKARVASAIAQYPELADQVAVLSSMKAEVRVEFASEELWGEMLACEGTASASALPLSSSFRSRRVGTLLAAALAILIVGVLALQVGMREPKPELLLAAIERHAALSQAPGGNLRSTRSLVRFDSEAALLPDLESGRLSLNAVADFKIPSGAVGLAAHYRGTRGCKLTLFLLPEANMTEAAVLFSSSLRRLSKKPVQAYGWRHGSVGYLLMADGMSEVRLGLIAEKLFDASKTLRLLDEKAKQQLADSRKRSSPCRA